MSALDALENAAAEFTNLMNDLARRVRANKQMSRELEKETKEVQEMHVRAGEELRNAHAKVNDAERRIFEANRRAHDAEIAEARIKDILATIRTEQEALKTKEAELRTHSNRIQLETNLKLSNIKNQTERQLAEMRLRVAEAERERALTHDKNCTIAKQLQQAQERLKGRKNLAPPGASTAKTLGLAEKDRRIRALEAQLESREKTLQQLGIDSSQHRLNRPKATQVDNNTFFDLTRSSSPLENSNDDSPVTPPDGHAIPSQASTSAAGAPGASGIDRRGSVSPTPQRKAKKRARDSVSIEPERLDDESDEALYPMPGQRVQARPQRPDLMAALWQAANAGPAARPSSSTNTEPEPPTTQTSKASSSSGRKSPARSPNNKRKARASDTSSNTSKASSNEYGWLKNAGNVQLGPKRRSKAK